MSGAIESSGATGPSRGASGSPRLWEGTRVMTAFKNGVLTMTLPETAAAMGTTTAAKTD